MMRQMMKAQRLKSKLQQELGAALLAYLSDPLVQEILLNPDGMVWIDHANQGLVATNISFTALQAQSLIGTIAGFTGTVVNATQPILETVLPFTGYRFEGLIPPVVSAPTFSIRKFAQNRYSLQDYVNQNALNLQQVEKIHYAIDCCESILIVGGPGTGKTTFANALLQEMAQRGDPHQRFVILEDTPELQCAAPNTVYLKTTRYADHSQLLRATLRLRPDKICVGECRGKEMLTLLKAWNTGTPGGLATLHANSAESALIRVAEMAEESGSPVSPHLVCESIQWVIALQRDPLKGRVVQSVLRLVDYQEGNYVFSND